MGGADCKSLVSQGIAPAECPRLRVDAFLARQDHGVAGLRMRRTDALFPLLVNQDLAAQARENFLKGGYEPLDPTHGHMNLMRNAAQTEWDIPYENLTLPTLVITGLQDRVFLDVEVVDRLFDRLADARREDWSDAGHLLPLEKPDALVDSLARFGQELMEKTR